MYDLWPLGTGKINLWGGVGLDLYQGHGNLTTAIKSQTRENAAILGVFFGGFWTPMGAPGP